MSYCVVSILKIELLWLQAKHHHFLIDCCCILGVQIHIQQTINWICVQTTSCFMGIQPTLSIIIISLLNIVKVPWIKNLKLKEEDKPIKSQFKSQSQASKKSRMLIKRIIGTKCNIKRTGEKKEKQLLDFYKFEVVMHEMWENSRIRICKNKNIKTEELERKNPCTCVVESWKLNATIGLDAWITTMIVEAM